MRIVCAADCGVDRFDDLGRDQAGGIGLNVAVHLRRLCDSADTVSVLAPIGAIVGDFYAGSSAGGQAGLGFLTIVYSSQFKMGALLAAAAVSCGMGFIFSGGVVFLSWMALNKWHDSYRRSES